MDEYFEKYKAAKRCLLKMLTQFYKTELPLADAIHYGITLVEDDIDYIYMSVNACFHNCEANGILAWHYLNLPNDYVAVNQLYKLEDGIKDEAYTENIDYEQEYLKLSILLIDLTNVHYRYMIPLKSIKDNSTLKYDEDFDVIDDMVVCCDNLCEGAGESVWNLFNIDSTVVGKYEFDRIRDEYVERLIELKNTREINHSSKKRVRQ